MKIRKAIVNVTVTEHGEKMVTLPLGAAQFLVRIAKGGWKDGSVGWAFGVIGWGVLLAMIGVFQPSNVTALVLFSLMWLFGAVNLWATFRKWRQLVDAKVGFSSDEE